jgi:hypothetical protein
LTDGNAVNVPSLPMKREQYGRRCSIALFTNTTCRKTSENMELRIEIFDAQGNTVRDELIEADTATEAEVDDMVRMIEGGMPACIAAAVVKNSRKE